MPIIKDTTLEKVKVQIQRRNALLKNFVELYAETTWDTVQLNVKAGLAPTLYAIGDEMICKYTANGVEYDFTWVVVDNDREVTWEDGTVHPGLILLVKYATIESVQFDAPEHEVATEQTALDGWYYCGLSGGTYTMLNLATGATIPYSDYEAVYHGSINNKDVYQYGYNRYLMSAQRQWLNSDKPRNEWWTSQHPGDTAPAQLGTVDGFIVGLDPDFVSVVNPVKVQVAANTVTDGGVTDVMFDRFWLPSIEEMYGAPQAEDVEGAYFPYWKTKTGLDAPSNAANNGRIITALNAQASAQPCRCRSALRGSASSAWNVYTTGSLFSYYAPYAYRCAPACAIS